MSLLIAAVLLAVLGIWGGVDFGEMWASWRRLPAGSYALALGIHVGIYMLRALRFRILIPVGERPSFGVVAAVSAAHNLAAYVLPAKTGEASLILYLKRVGGVGGAVGLASLLVSRVLDLAFLSGLSGVACLLLAGRSGMSEWLPLAGGGLLLVSLALLVAATRAEVVLKGMTRVVSWLGIARTKLGRALLDNVDRAGEAMRSAGRGTGFLAALCLSLPLWVGVFLFYAVLARGLGLFEELDLLSATFGSSLAVAFNLLPVNGFAAFGTQEAGWVLGFTLLGASRDAAFASGVGAHLVQLFNVVLFGVVGHVVMGVLGGRGERRAEVG